MISISSDCICKLISHQKKNELQMKKIKKSLKNYLKYVKPWTMCLVPSCRSVAPCLNKFGRMILELLFHV